MMRAIRLRVLLLLLTARRRRMFACAVLLLTAVLPARASMPPTHPEKQHKPHSVHLAWHPNPVGDKTVGYNIYRATANKGGRGNTQLVKLNPSPVQRPEYDDMSVRSHTTYLYVVKSVNAKGKESPPSNAIKLSVP